MVLRHTAALIILSLLILFIPHALYSLMQSLDSAYQFIVDELDVIFNTSGIGDVLRHLIAILLIPLLAGGIPAGIYWASKRRKMPYTIQIIWIVWIAQAVAVSILSTQLLSVTNHLA
jgi:hypothetical protein